jgi:hypothetical protein
MATSKAGAGGKFEPVKEKQAQDQPGYYPTDYQIYTGFKIRLANLIPYSTVWRSI